MVWLFIVMKKDAYLLEIAIITRYYKANTRLCYTSFEYRANLWLNAYRYKEFLVYATLVAVL